MRGKLAILHLVLVLALTACTSPAPVPQSPQIESPGSILMQGDTTRPGVEQVTVVWQRSFSNERDCLDYVLVDHPEGIILGCWDDQQAGQVFMRNILDPISGVEVQTVPVEQIQTVLRKTNLVVYGQEEQVLLDSRSGTVGLPSLPEAEGWLDAMPLEQEVILMGYQLSGRFVTRLDQQGEVLWSYSPPRRSPQDVYVFETFGSREQLVKLDEGLLGLYGLSIRGLIALDIATGELAWEYHIPQENRISDVSVGKDGIWVAGVSNEHAGVVTLLTTEGEILREVEHSAPVTAIGALADKACWFMAGWGPDGNNEVFFLEDDRLASEVLPEVDFTNVPQLDDAFVFLNGMQGVLYLWQPRQYVQTYDLPFSGRQSQVLGARDGVVIVRNQNEIYAVTLTNQGE